MNMHKPSWISDTFDAGNLITLTVLLITAVTAWNRMEANQQALLAWQTNSDKYYATNLASTEARFVAIETKIAPFDSMIYRLTKAEGEITNTSTRVDRIVDSFGDKLEVLRKDINNVGTQVQVLTQTLDDQNRRRDSSGLVVPKPND